MVIVVVVIAVLAIVGVALAYHTYSFTITETSGLLLAEGSFNRSFPVGAQVSGSWSTPSGVSVSLDIQTPGGTIVYGGYGDSGSFSFTANYAYYLFSASSAVPTPVSVSGSYWAF